jgi:hypothetical protein
MSTSDSGNRNCMHTQIADQYKNNTRATWQS